MTDPLTGAATIVGLSVAAKPALDLVKDFLGRVLAPTGDALGKSLAHPIVEWQKRRVERASKLVADAAAIVAESGQEPQPVPGRLLMPILEKGSLEEEPDLYARWVALLSNAAINSSAVLPAFVSILGELSPVEARVLRRLYSVQADQKYLRVVGTTQGAASKRLGELQQEAMLEPLKEFSGIESDADFELMIANLQRLDRVGVAVAHKDWHSVHLTRLGRGLVAACTRSPSPQGT